MSLAVRYDEPEAAFSEVFDFSRYAKVRVSEPDFASIQFNDDLGAYGELRAALWLGLLTVLRSIWFICILAWEDARVSIAQFYLRIADGVTSRALMIACFAAGSIWGCVATLLFVLILT